MNFSCFILDFKQIKVYINYNYRSILCYYILYYDKISKNKHFSYRITCLENCRKYPWFLDICYGIFDPLVDKYGNHSILFKNYFDDIRPSRCLQVHFKSVWVKKMWCCWDFKLECIFFDLQYITWVLHSPQWVVKNKPVLTWFAPMCVSPGEAPTDLYNDRTARRQGTQTPLQISTSALHPGEPPLPAGRWRESNRSVLEINDSC